jgi:predicted GIY-YIG superfamily endonuclease
MESDIVTESSTAGNGSPNDVYLCYVLHSADGKRTYVGITNNLTRRLRQHNGEISGGAKYTKRDDSRPWTVVLTVHGFRTKVEALQFEWAFHHMKGARGLSGRVVKLRGLLRKRQWTRSAPAASAVPLTIRVYAGEQHDMLMTALDPLPPHCTLVPC